MEIDSLLLLIGNFVFPLWKIKKNVDNTDEERKENRKHLTNHSNF